MITLNARIALVTVTVMILVCIALYINYRSGGNAKSQESVADMPEV